MNAKTTAAVADEATSDVQNEARKAIGRHSGRFLHGVPPAVPVVRGRHPSRIAQTPPPSDFSEIASDFHLVFRRAAAGHGNVPARSTNDPSRNAKPRSTWANARTWNLGR